MILQALYELSVREHLMGDPDFEPKPVRYLLTVADGGKLLGGVQKTEVVEEVPEDSKRKPKSFARTFLVPRESARTSGDRAFFLVDKAEYVLGIDPAGMRDVDKLHIRFELFREKVHACLAATRDPGVKAVADFLDRLGGVPGSVELPEDCATNDLFAFIYAPDIDLLVHERSAVREYWAAERAEDEPSGDGGVRCMVTGKPCLPVDKHPVIKRVPGGSTSGIALISFNKNAFESYGLEGAENAPISREASEATMTALNRLIHPAYPDPADTNRSLTRRNSKLSADTVACYWTRKGGDRIADMMNTIMNPDLDQEEPAADPEELRRLYQSIWSGRPFPVATPTAFYSLVLSGAQGRATLRDWIESNTQNVVNNLAAYFADLRMVRRNSPIKGKSHPPGFPIGELLEAIAEPRERRAEGVPAHVAAGFYRAAITGELFPYAVLPRAVARYRIEVAQENAGGAEGWRARQWNDARAALIRAVLLRLYRQSSTSTNKEIHPIMNPTCTDEGYVLGQLIAVLERLQAAALGDINASVIDRYFSGASAAPRSIFINLLKSARHHARKGMDDKQNAGFVFRLERLVDELADRFLVVDPRFQDKLASQVSNGFPASLDQNQQGLFIIGYHQMRKWLWLNKEERAQWEKENPDAPRAYIWSKTREAEPENQNV